MTGRRLAVFFAGVAVAASSLAAGSASSAETIPGRIVPGVGVGGLKLGMSEAAARRVLRPLGTPIRYRRNRPVRLRSYAEYQYPSFDEGFGVAWYIVGFHGRAPARRVVMIDVRTQRNTTAQGVRVGSTERQLRAAFPRIDCRDSTRYARFNLLCYLGSVKATHTIFPLRTREVISGRPNDEVTKRVWRIIIRRPFVPLDFRHD